MTALGLVLIVLAAVIYWSTRYRPQHKAERRAMRSIGGQR